MYHKRKSHGVKGDLPFFLFGWEKKNGRFVIINWGIRGSDRLKVCREGPLGFTWQKSVSLEYVGLQRKTWIVTETGEKILERERE